MKQLRTWLLLEVIALMIIIGCAVTPEATEATWKTVPESHIPYERAWAIVVNAVGERFDIETADAQSGYLRTGWKTTGKDWLGEPIQKTRVVVRVEERKPFKVKVKAEMQKISILTDEWQDGGNDPKMEQEIMQDLAGRLR